MEKGDRRESEESVKDDLHIQDPMTDQVQGVDLHGSHSHKQVQKSEDLAQDGASKLGSTHETQELVQQEKEDSTQKVYHDSVQKSEEESHRQEIKNELAEDELEQRKDVNILMQQREESSLASAQDPGPTHQKVAEAVPQETDELSEDGDMVSQRTGETPESILLLSGQEPTRRTRQEDMRAVPQEPAGIPEYLPLRRNFEENLTDELREQALKDGFIALIDDLSRSPRHGANSRVRPEWDRATENDGHRQGSESGEVSEEFQGLQSRSPEEGSRRPRRTRQRRAHVIQLHTLAPIQEALDEPVVPFEVEIQVRRHWRRRLPNIHLPNGIGEYMQRVHERHVPPERQTLFEELQRRCVKLFCGLLIGGMLIVALYYLINFLESKYGTSSDFNATAALPDLSVNLNIPMTALIPDTYVTDTTTAMDDMEVSNINSVVRRVLNDMNTNGTNPVNSLV